MKSSAAFQLFTGMLWLFLVSLQSKSTVHITLKGKVVDEFGKGIPSVMVTDGTNCVFTSANGKYLLQSTNEAEFVYITVPSGYEIPNDEKIAKFYHPISNVKKGVFTSDFSLVKMQQSDTKHFTIVWADPQINTDEHARKLNEDVAEDTRKHAEELRKIGPVTGIAAGDIYWDNPKMVEPYKNAVRTSGISFFQVLGNHDMDINTRSDEKADETFKRSFGPTWYSFNRGKAHYVVLDNVFYYSDNYNYIGYITEKQLKWLAQDLAAVEPGSPVFVSMHIPLYTHEKEREKLKQDNQGNVTFNRKFLYEMLKSFKAHILTGHTHYNENRIEGEVYEHIHAAVCSAWWTGPVCEDGTPGGYGVYEVNDNEVRWYYKSTGKPSSYQMKVYGRNSYPSRPETITANVWNWDPKWQVIWYEDGRKIGPMKQVLDYDADALKYLNGNSKYTWMKARLTDHLFTAKPSANAKTIKVEVIDRFGITFTEEIKL